MKLNPLNLLKSTASVVIAAGVFLSPIASAQAQDIGSTDFTYLTKGNQGPTLSLFDGDVTVSARSSIDPTQPYNLYASGLTGSINYVQDKSIYKSGLGVQALDGKGSGAISGGGGHQNEELIFTYNNGGAIASSISLQVNLVEWGSKSLNPSGFNEDKSDVALWITYDFGQVFAVNEFSLYNAATPLGTVGTGDVFGTKNQTISKDNSYLIDFGNIAGFDSNATVTSFTIRETKGHTLVNGFNAGVVPEPSGVALIMAGYGFLLMFRRRR